MKQLCITSTSSSLEVIGSNLSMAQDSDNGPTIRLCLSSYPYDAESCTEEIGLMFPFLISVCAV